MEIIELIMVFGSLEDMIANLMVTGVQIVTMMRVTTLRFSILVRRVIERVDGFHDDKEFEDFEEKEIFISYLKTAKKFHKIMMWPAIMTTVSWFITPMQNHLLALMQNQSVPLVAPFRMPSFIDMTRVDVAIIVYTADIPMMYLAVCYLATYSIHFTFINYVCAHLAILTRRIRNLKVDRVRNMREVFGGIVEMHIQLMQITSDLNSSTGIAFLTELLNTTLLIGLLSYNILIKLETAESALILNLICYMLTMIALVFTNCYMGEYLGTQAMNLFEAYCQCNWNELPISYQRAFIICMIQAQTPLEMSAGKFYKFSLNGFTHIMKSSMAYVSMLRTIV